ncbi:MAG: hypothetical protein AAB588_02450 [Patescibacteria group bacterium]
MPIDGYKIETDVADLVTSGRAIILTNIKSTVREGDVAATETQSGGRVFKIQQGARVVIATLVKAEDDPEISPDQNRRHFTLVAAPEEVIKDQVAARTKAELLVEGYREFTVGERKFLYKQGATAAARGNGTSLNGNIGPWRGAYSKGRRGTELYRASSVESLFVATLAGTFEEVTDQTEITKFEAILWPSRSK